MDNPIQPDWLGQKPNTPTPPPPPPPPDRPKPPLSPPPEITIRTMKTDLELLKETGGAPPTPKPFTPPELKREWPQPPPPPSKIAPSEFGEPQKMEIPKPESKQAPIIEEEKPKSKRKLFIWIGAGFILIVTGLIGYFVIFPALFPLQTPPPPPPAVTAPPTEIQIAEIPPLEIPSAELPPIEIPEEVPAPEIIEAPPPTPMLKSHQSLLKTTDGTSPAELTTLDLDSLKNALGQEAQKSNLTGTLIEITLSDANGQIAASNALSSMLPEISTETARQLFEEDFTTALYYDTDGVWPTYIFKLSLNTSIAEAQTTVSALENSQSLSNLFLSSPGTASTAGFKDGKANDIPTRYLTFSKKGAAINFAWSGDKLIISTSYNGLKKVLSNLVE